MRHALGGGYQANSENVSGHSVCVRPEQGYGPIRSILTTTSATRVAIMPFGAAKCALFRRRKGPKPLSEWCSPWAAKRNAAAARLALGLVLELMTLPPVIRLSGLSTIPVRESLLPCPIPPYRSPQPLQAAIGAPTSAYRPPANFPSTRIRARIIGLVTPSPPFRCFHGVHPCPSVDSSQLVQVSVPQTPQS